MKLGLGELVSRITDTNLKLWDVQDWVYKVVAMEPHEFAATSFDETQDKLKALASLNLMRNKEMVAIDQLAADVFAQRKGKWVLGYSQFGEHDDVDEAIEGMTTGYAVEVGCADGVSMSNTKHLEDRGWQVLCIEANPFYEAELRKNRKNVMMVACGAADVAEADFHVCEISPGNQSGLSSLVRLPGTEPIHTIRVPVMTLDHCLEQSGFPRVDVLSIDVEGGEANVLAGFNLEKWQPRIVILEDWEGGQHVEYMAAAGYVFKRRTTVNEVFIRG